MKTEKSEQAGFVVMAKPVGALCNLRCSYCYYLTADARTGVSSYRMSDEMLETYVKSYIDASPGPVVQFNWHGGEPTLAGLDYYQKAVELQRKYLPEGWQCFNNIQTNGVLIDDEWAAFFAEYHFDVGLSTDCAPVVHDTFRRTAAGEGSFEYAERACETLRKAGISPDILCTVTKLSCEHTSEVWEGVKTLNTGWVQFIPIVVRQADGSVTEDSVTTEGYGKFLCDLFDEWIYRDLGQIDVQLFAETALVLSGGKPTLCTLAETCGQVPIVEHDGSVYSCDHFVDKAHFLGNLVEHTLSELVNSEAQLRFGADKRDSLTEKCRSCPYLALCRGGCLKDRFTVNEDGEEKQYALCEGLKMYFGHAVPLLTEMIAMSRKGMNTAAIRDSLRTQKRAQIRKIGRNDPCPCGSGRKFKACCMKRYEKLLN